MALLRRAQTIDLDALRLRLERDIHDHRFWYVFQGIVFIVFGLFAAAMPGIAAFSATLYIGALLLVSGAFQLFTSMKSRMHWWTFLSALLSMGIGAWMLWAPLLGLFSLIIVATIFFAVEGIIEIMLALEYHAVRSWGWMMAAGITTLIIAVLLWTGFPGLSIYYLGWLIAINFVFYGLSLLILASNAPSRP